MNIDLLLVLFEVCVPYRYLLCAEDDTVDNEIIPAVKSAGIALICPEILQV